ncbi:MAG: biopolymer transporter ExbD [Deltaproteobacteria bacterium]|jgi:biopolymer transport protein ExbD|nr:biopolymer transporter ExbD [Deltaproteobacteria bacterium]
MGKLSLGRKKDDQQVEINMSPMIDMTFLLLIFFIVTTTFVKESGVEVNRPIASTATSKEDTNIIIGVTKEGMIYIENQIIDIRSVRSRMERFKSEMPDGNVVITADKDSLFGVAIEVLDQVRLAGIKNVVVAATKE